MTRKPSLALATLAVALSLPSAPALADGNALSFNASVATEYRYRGISQSRLKPALQGGVDYADASGLYLGAWGSTIRWVKDAGGDSAAELDFYGGYKTEIAKGLTLDLGLLQYVYPSYKLSPSGNTLEAYGALSYGPATLKVSRSFGNLFGFADSNGSLYYDLSATFDLGEGWSVVPHIGRQNVAHNRAASYTDASLTLNKAMDAWTLGLSLIDAKTGAYVGPAGKDLGARRVVASLKYTF